MKRLFEVPDGRRVRITSKKIRYKDTDELETIVGEDITWTGTTTEHYWQHDGVTRRLISETTIQFKGRSSIWQRDCKCYVIG